VQALTESLVQQGLSNRVLSERQLERVAGGDAPRRYGLVNRALKANELIRIRRGLYVLSPRYRTEPPHPFAVAQAIVPGSYVSLETALSLHGWIPESVRVTASVVPGRKSQTLEHPLLGSFTFRPLAMHRLHFLQLVERRQLGQQTALIAKPLRALADLVCLRKIEWQGVDWLTGSLRIDEDNLRSIVPADILTLATVYKQKRTLHFLEQLAKELRLE
jgi:hypothetical protein